MNTKPPTAIGQTHTRLADISVGQEADTVWFLNKVPGGPAFPVNYVERWEGQDEDGDRQTWVKGMNSWKRIA